MMGVDLVETGTVVIPYECDAAMDFQEGLAHVMLNGKYGNPF